jgi:hypothetical protein
MASGTRRKWRRRRGRGWADWATWQRQPGLRGRHRGMAERRAMAGSGAQLGVAQERGCGGERTWEAMLSGCSYRSYARMLSTGLWWSKRRAESLSSIQSPVFRPEMSGGITVRSQSGAASSRAHFLPLHASTPAREGRGGRTAARTSQRQRRSPTFVASLHVLPRLSCLVPPVSPTSPFATAIPTRLAPAPALVTATATAPAPASPANSAAPWRPTCHSHARTHRPRPSMQRAHHPSLCQTLSSRIQALTPTLMPPGHHLPRLPRLQTKTRHATPRQSRTPLRPSASPHRTRPPRHSPWTSTRMARCATPTRQRAHVSYAPAQLARRRPYHGTMNPSTRPRQCRAPSRRALRTFRTS